MARITRREFAVATMGTSLAASAAWTLVPESLRAEETTAVGELRVATFRFDVTPPMGHSCCGGWITPVVAVDDSLEAIGIVLLGAGKPIVLCAVDWTGLLNSAHIRWREALADAAGTTPDRVAVHCVHQHNAPFACLDAQKLVAAQAGLPAIVDTAFYEECLAKGKKAIAEALPTARRVTHVAGASSRVDQVASNRRISRNEKNQVVGTRSSACKDPALRDMPEGLIDPDAKTIAFYDGDDRVAALHYYATHPMSYYGDGRVSSDFPGLARKRLQADEPKCTHIYFTGCAGNVTAGKYNDGSKPMRDVLATRVHDALVAGLKKLEPQPVKSVGWSAVDLLPQLNPAIDVEKILKQIADPAQSVVNRNRPSYQVAFARRIEAGQPIVISALKINGLGMLHLPAESFVEYQLAAQQMVPDRMLATAAYGDGGPWYIPTDEEYDCGGYEVSVANADRKIDPAMREAIGKVLRDA
jgi:hypothetical protein